MNLDEALALQPVPNKMYLDVGAMCTCVGLPVTDSLNVIALDLARRYSKGLVLFDVADAMINNLFFYCSKNIASLLGAAMPEPMFSVFLAFDSGEFYPDDVRDPTQEERFTKPMIAALLAKIDSAA